MGDEKKWGLRARIHIDMELVIFLENQEEGTEVGA